ncbi:MAG TPA: peptidylprolyl isomerase [Verrucomicrobiae bacterium]|nr:peptidylprolyl isomerase [Verrucomicrobiae bacterium]
MKFFRLILICALVSGFNPCSRAELADGILAIVNDTVITRGQLEDFIAPAIETLRRQYGSQEGILEQKANQAMSDGLEQLIERALILHDFDVQGYKLPDSYVDQLVQDRIRDRFYGDRVTFLKTLQAQGETFEQFREDIRDQFIELEWRRRNVSQQIVISPYKIENYYNAHTNDFKVEDQVKLRMIVLNKTGNDDTNTVALADEILGEIKHGASFAQMAAVYSQGSQRNQSGEWDWVERSVLRKELADAAAKLKPGEISGVIETPETCYIMLLEDTRPAHIKSLNDVRDDIEATLVTQQQKQLQQQWIDSLKRKTFIRLF